MRFKRFLVALATGLLLIPTATSALTLSSAGQVQLAQLASQLLGVFNQIAQAQALGTAYTSSPGFQAEAVKWTTQLVQIQQQLSVLIASAVPSTPTITPIPGSSSISSCPDLSRDLLEGAQGSDVAALQLFLANDAYAKLANGVTGYFDAATTQAVQRYQIGYGIASYGTPSTTGFGRVGPGTRASIYAVCTRGSYVVSVPPITIPATQVPTYQPPVTTPPPTTVQTNYSTGQLSLVPSLTGQSGGPTSVTFSVNMLPNSSCSSAAFTLAFGDGQTQVISSNATCGNQIVQVAHVYPSTGAYTAVLSSGPFQTQLAVNIQAANNSLTLSAATDPGVSYGGTITATYNPGATCVIPATYTLSFGDSSSQTLTFSSGCALQAQSIKHTYSQSIQHLISASNSAGQTVTTALTPVFVSNAGAGDPFQVLSLHGEGTNNSTIFADSSPRAHIVTPGGNARIDTANPKVGSGSMRFDGTSYISTPASTDFNFGSGPFTIDLWVKPSALPAANGQAAILVQAGSSAADTTLGGAGLELFGNQIYFVGSIGGVTYHPFYSNSIHTGDLTAGTWYHVTLVRAGNTVALYLNGTSVGTLSVFGSANASSAALSLGRYGEFNSNYFNGWIDEVEIVKGVARPPAAPVVVATTTPSTAPGSKTGLKGEYFNGVTLTGLLGTFTDPVIDFPTAHTTLGTARAGGSTTFSVRWTGWVKADYTETYTFYTTSDDGVSFTVNSANIINNWTTHGDVENSGTINLIAGTWYPVTLEYFNNSSDGAIQLRYSSASVSKKIIPSTNLSSN